MLVVYKGHDRALMTDYNGRRYNFRPGIPVDIPTEVYNYIIQGEHVSSKELMPCEIKPEIKQETVRKTEPILEEKPRKRLYRRRKGKK